MHIIRIEDSKVDMRSGTSQRTGKPYSMKEQKAYLVGFAKYPVEISLTLPDDVQFYVPGDYTAETPFTVGRFGRLELNRNLTLTPVKALASATRAA